MKSVLIAVFLLVLGILAVFNIMTIRTNTHPNQQIFLQGKIPQAMPNGAYTGSAEFMGTWRGKTFDAATATGINHFEDDNSQKSDAYPFKTYVAKGIRDKNLDVIKIDYNVPQNPLWLRPILDEIVEIEPGVFLGKVNARILPGFAFSLGWFRLTAPAQPE